MRTAIATTIFGASCAWLLRIRTRYLILVALLITFILVIPVAFLTSLYPEIPMGGPQLDRQHLIKLILIGCIIAPLQETAVFQWAGIRLLQKFRYGKLVQIIFSALIFGLCHSYSVFYVFHAFLIGIVLACVFVIEDMKGGRPFIATLAVHALRNWVTAIFVVFII